MEKRKEIQKMTSGVEGRLGSGRNNFYLHTQPAFRRKEEAKEKAEENVPLLHGIRKDFILGVQAVKINFRNDHSSCRAI